MRRTYKTEDETKEIAEDVHGFDVERLQDEYDVAFENGRAYYPETKIAVPMTYSNSFTDDALRESNQQVLTEKSPNDTVACGTSRWFVDLEGQDTEEVTEGIEFLNEMTNKLRGYCLLDEELMSRLEFEKIENRMDDLMYDGFRYTFKNVPYKPELLADWIREHDEDNRLQRICHDSCMNCGGIFMNDRKKDEFKECVNELLEEHISSFDDAVANILTEIKEFIKDKDEQNFVYDIEDYDFAVNTYQSMFQHLEDLVMDALWDKDYKYVFCDLLVNGNKHEAKNDLEKEIIKIIENQHNNEVINEYLEEYKGL